MNDKLKKLAAEASGVLRDDPELAQEVSQELENHLEDKIAELVAGGTPKADAEDMALKSFGSIEEVAEGLLQSNRSRMNLRAQARLVARFVLAPLAVLIALFMGIDMSILSISLHSLYGLDHGFDHLKNSQIWSQPLSPEKIFLLSGDRTRSKQSEQQRAIWEKYPDNMAFYGNYLTHLLMDLDKDKVGLDFFESEVRKGEEMDPNNSRYAILLGTTLIDKGVHWERTSNLKFAVKDRKILDRGMAELLRVPSLSHRYSSGGTETSCERLSGLPCTTFIDQINQLYIACDTIAIIPKISTFHAIRSMPHYARLLVAEGKREEAAKVLMLWRPLAERIIGGSSTFLEIVMCKATINIAQNDIASACDELGFVDLGKQTRRETGYFANIAQREEAYPLIKKIRSKAGIIGGMMIPLSISIADPDIQNILSEESLRVSRWNEFVFFEKISATCMVSCFLLIMLMHLIFSFFSRMLAGAKPMLLLPPLWESMKIFCYGVLLPIGIYFIYSRFMPFSGRDVNVSKRFFIEAGILFLALWIIPTVLSARYHRRRYQELGMNKKGYFKTVARSLVPVYALMIVLISLLTGPYLRSTERDFVQRDDLLNLDHHSGFSRIESEAVRKLKNDFASAFAQIQQEKESNPIHSKE